MDEHGHHEKRSEDERGAGVSEAGAGIAASIGMAKPAPVIAKTRCETLVRERVRWQRKPGAASCRQRAMIGVCDDFVEPLCERGNND